MLKIYGLPIHWVLSTVNIQLTNSWKRSWLKSLLTGDNISNYLQLCVSLSVYVYTCSVVHVHICTYHGLQAQAQGSTGIKGKIHSTGTYRIFQSEGVRKRHTLSSWFFLLYSLLLSCSSYVLDYIFFFPTTYISQQTFSGNIEIRMCL